MGVSGSGKTTIGSCAARKLNAGFIDADDHHPHENIVKMAAGVPLTNADRSRWLDALIVAINSCAESLVVVACSALNEYVRARLVSGVTRPVKFIQLQVSPAVLAARLQARPKHFMKAEMLPSQLAAFEPAADAIVIRGEGSIAQVCAAVSSHIQQLHAS
jgi:carbohydrate kinase (thermoresistant glucokinase family)